MRKAVCFLLLAVICFLCGCSEFETSSSESNIKAGYVKGVWFSYSEIDAMILSGDFSDNFKNAIENCVSLGITDVFFHTRPFSDSFYASQYFPTRNTANQSGVDILKTAVDICKNKGLRIHAWINPYRVRSSDSDISTLESDSVAYKILNDDIPENDTDICVSNGIWLNPASVRVRRLVIDGIREIALNYDIDGIHIDDYFYPTTDASFDEASYKEYCQNNEKPLSLGDWRRVNINALISGCYTAVKFIDKELIFSVSPAASIERNFDTAYADIKAFAESGCVDWLIPQLYFGFDYPDSEYTFENLINEWANLTQKSNTRLIIGLAAYKVGTDAEPDKNEWSDETLLSRQVKRCEEDKHISGHCFFSYSSLFGETEKQKASTKRLYP